YGSVPLSDFSLLKEDDIAPFFFDWIQHSTLDEYWEQWSLESRYAAMNVPAVHIGGWYDVFRDGTIANFNGLRREASRPAVREGQKLIIGPWYHTPWASDMGTVDFGSQAGWIVDEVQVDWFDHFLKGKPTRVTSEPAVRAFVMGERAWRDFEAWPPPDVEFVHYYLHSDGHANSLNGNGTLTSQRPRSEPPDEYAFDPHFAVPSMGGHSCCLPDIAPMGPVDQRPVERFNSVLVYSTEPLREELLVAGPVRLTLFASSSAPDTDFVGKLVDVHPDGLAINLTEGILRCSYREGLTRRVPLVPFRVYKLAFDLGHTCNLFLPGHRVRLEVTSSHFPHWDRNFNSGNIPMTEGFESSEVAIQAVYHETNSPSYLRLPVQSG
ncbi:MAG: CocE/NonD family hydrolase, partial [bacterium]